MANERAERIQHLDYLRKVSDFVPNYSGSQAGLYDFLQACDWVYDQIDEDVLDAFLLIIKTKLRGDAEAFISSRNISDWETLKDLLTGHYSDARDIEGLGRELTVSVQSVNESPRQFLTRIQALLTKIRSSINLNPENTAADKATLIKSYETTALKTVLAGLRNPLGTTIRSQRPSDLNEVASLLIDEENIIYLQTRNNNIDKNIRGAIPKDLYNLPRRNVPQNPKFCNYCKRPGHNLSECRRRDFNQNNHFNNSNQNHGNNSSFYPRFLNNNQYRPNNVRQNPQFQNRNHANNSHNNQNRQQNPTNTNYERPSIIQRNPNYPVNYLNEQGVQQQDDCRNEPQASPSMNNVTRTFRDMSF